MKLSAPIYVLKQQAKAVSRRDKIRLHVALDRIAVREGFSAWSHLAANWQPEEANAAIFAQLRAGDLVLVGGRPGQGKTLLAIGLAIEAMTQGNHAAFFTLECTAADVAQCFSMLNKEVAEFGDRFIVDTSEEISARYITSRLAAAFPNSLIVIDYLQLLDQKRDNPALAEQVQELRDFALARKVIIVCLSQISRNYESASKAYPDLNDVRLPNPLDLSLFNKACFLDSGRMQLLVGS